MQKAGRTASLFGQEQGWASESARLQFPYHQQPLRGCRAESQEPLGQVCQCEHGMKMWRALVLPLLAEGSSLANIQR